MSIKTVVADKLTKVIDNFKGSEKDAAVRKLSLGYAIAAFGDKLKKDSRAQLEKLGLIKTGLDVGAHILFDSKTFRLTAKVAKPRKVFNEEALRKAIAAEYGDNPRCIQRVVEASYVDAASSVTYEVDEK